MSERLQYSAIAFLAVFIGVILLALLMQLLQQVVGLPITAGALTLAAAAGLAFYTWDLLTTSPAPVEPEPDDDDVP